MACYQGTVTRSPTDTTHVSGEILKHTVLQVNRFPSQQARKVLGTDISFMHSYSRICDVFCSRTHFSCVGTCANKPQPYTTMHKLPQHITQMCCVCLEVLGWWERGEVAMDTVYPQSPSSYSKSVKQKWIWWVGGGEVAMDTVYPCSMI